MGGGLTGCVGEGGVAHACKEVQIAQGTGSWPLLHACAQPPLAHLPAVGDGGTGVALGRLASSSRSAFSAAALMLSALEGRSMVRSRTGEALWGGCHTSPRKARLRRLHHPNMDAVIHTQSRPHQSTRTPPAPHASPCLPYLAYFSTIALRFSSLAASSARSSGVGPSNRGGGGLGLGAGGTCDGGARAMACKQHAERLVRQQHAAMQAACPYCSFSGPGVSCALPLHPSRQCLRACPPLDLLAAAWGAGGTG